MEKKLINLKSTNGTTVSNFSELEEIWKDIKNYERLYQVSNYGNVKSLGNGKAINPNFSKERILKQVISNNGYCFVCLCKEGMKKLCSVHRLVCTAFIPNPNNYPCVNHINEQKTDNRVDNLEWVTQKYNINYGTHNERVSKTLKGMKRTQEAKNKMSKAMKGKKKSQEHKDNIGKAKSKPIVQLTKNSEFIKQWKSAKQASNELNIFATNITHCLKGKYNFCGGFKWMYAKDYYNTRTLNRMKNIFTKLNELKQVG